MSYRIHPGNFVKELKLGVSWRWLWGGLLGRQLDFRIQGNLAFTVTAASRVSILFEDWQELNRASAPLPVNGGARQAPPMWSTGPTCGRCKLREKNPRFHGTTKEPVVYAETTPKVSYFPTNHPKLLLQQWSLQNVIPDPTSKQLQLSTRPQRRCCDAWIARATLREGWISRSCGCRCMQRAMFGWIWRDGLLPLGNEMGLGEVCVSSMHWIGWNMLKWGEAGVWLGREYFQILRDGTVAMWGFERSERFGRGWPGTFWKIFLVSCHSCSPWRSHLSWDLPDQPKDLGSLSTRACWVRGPQCPPYRRSDLTQSSQEHPLKVRHWYPNWNRNIMKHLEFVYHILIALET